MTARSTIPVAVAVSLGVFALVLAPSPAVAGDPCPIGIAVVDLGLPDWAEPPLRERVKDGDPLLARMVRVARQLDCSDIKVEPTRNGKITVGLHEKVDPARMQVDRVKGKLVDAKRRFRCDRRRRRPHGTAADPPRI